MMARRKNEFDNEGGREGGRDKRKRSRISNKTNPESQFQSIPVGSGREALS